MLQTFVIKFAFMKKILNTLRRIPPRQKSILLILTSAFFFTMMDVVAKYLIQNYPSNQVLWARYTSQSVASILLFSPILRKVLITNNLKLQLIRSTFLFLATFFFFTSLKYMPLAEVNAIFQASPIIVTLLSAIILKEFVDIRRWTGVIFGMVGALIIIRPGSDLFSIYFTFPLLAALCYASYIISTRHLNREEHVATNFIYSSLVGTIIASILAIQDWTPIKNSDLFLFCIIGLIGGVGHVGLIFAFKISQASFLAPFTYTTLLFAGLWGFLIFNEIPTYFTFFGAAIIVSSGIFVWIKDQNRNKYLPN